MICGRRAGSAPDPSSRVGASIHWPDSSSALSEQLLDSQPFAAIQRAPGATPMLFAPPSPPTIVPIVWVPWLLLSHGIPPARTCDGSNQRRAGPRRTPPGCCPVAGPRR